MEICIIFLSEIKQSTTAMHLICIDLGFAHGFVVDWVGKGGGLALLWTNVFQLQQSFVSQSLIAIEIVDPGGCHWRLIGFSSRKRKERDVVGEAGGVLQGENAIPVTKGALVPLMNFSNKGLKRIGIVRAMVRSPWRQGRCVGLYGGPCPSC
ncbi:hypothetical protein SLEP1_g37018 [Rubroshorea leprosula]|uniref:Uncharacterized protein n=1 Tax=Rubroshorea leprosula TaxID=152421 RepID=A0AAV5KTF0_9ROSI|nr:hypothetical protein SLEP1_g37018 [Rubroshorea leprosula]